jgi:hypothetical protein
MSGDHVDRVMLDRLFARTGGGPLGVEEFDALHRHLADCPGCQGEFERQRERHLQGDDALTEGQVATILNVVLERGRRLEADLPSPSRAAVRGTSPQPPSRRWARPVLWGLGGALAAACAALLLFPSSGWRTGDWGVRGADETAVSQDLFCFDSSTESATPLTGPHPLCPVGRTVTIQARAIRDFRWISVVACDRGACKLLDSQAAASPTVSLFGPSMEAARSWTVITIWSGSPVRQADVDRAVESIRARGGDPNALRSLSLEQPHRQLVATVGPGTPPS